MKKRKQLAIILFGMSYCEYVHWLTKNRLLIDFRESVDNYNTHIVGYFDELKYDINFYLSTNKLDPKNEKKLMETYKPIASRFYENKKNKNASRNEKVLGGIKLCLDNTKEYDLVLLTRFDLLFQDDWRDFDIDFDKLNITSVLETDSVICDNLYIMPYNMLHEFYKIGKNKINETWHNLKNPLTNSFGEINYIKNEKKTIVELTFYKIVRNVI